MRVFVLTEQPQIRRKNASFARFVAVRAEASSAEASSAEAGNEGSSEDRNVHIPWSQCLVQLPGRFHALGEPDTRDRACARLRKLKGSLPETVCAWSLS